MISTGLGSSSRLAHDDLVDLQDGENSVSGQLNCPALGLHRVQYEDFLGILDLSIAHIYAVSDALVRGLCIELSKDFLSLETSIIN